MRKHLLFFILSSALIHPSLSRASDQSAFYLESGTWDSSNFGTQTGCQLLRELIRQSILVSAELDHGYRICDASMEDLTPNTPTAPEIQLTFRFLEKKHFTYEIGLKDAEKPEIVQTTASALTDSSVYLKVLEQAEQQAQHFLADHLKSSTPQYTELKPSISPIPADNLDFVSLWIQLRYLNKELQLQGENIQLLGSMSKTYSTFGLVNYRTYSSLPKASLARGLVYAQRMVMKYPSEPAAYYARAYAWTLAGLDRFARNDIQKASTLGGPPPEWLPVIEAYLEADLTVLQQQVQTGGFNGQLAGLLGAFQTHNWNYADRFYEIVKPAMEINPGNLQYYSMAAEIPAISTGRRFTKKSFDALDNLLRRKLRTSQELDQEARDAVPLTKQTYETFYTNFRNGRPYTPPKHPPVDFPSLYSALIQRSDSDQLTPSHAALANLIRNTRFTFTYQRLDFMRFFWDVDTDIATKELLPSIEGHPCAPIIEAFSKDARINILTAQIQLTDPPYSMHKMLRGDLFDSQPNFANMNYRKAKLLAWNNADRNAFDYIRLLKQNEPVKNRRYLNTILGASPNNYVSVMFALSDDKTATDQFIHEHNKQIDSSADASCKIGLRYARKNNFEEARKMLEKSLAIEPTRTATEALADLHLKQGKVEDWLKLMEASMKFPDKGLENADTNYKIANQLAQLGRWDDAIIYAESGACSYSKKTLEQAGWINGLAGYTERGRDYMEAAAKRYNKIAKVLNFYLIFECKPSSEEIAEFIKATYEKQSRSSNSTDRARVVAYHLLANDPEKAIDLLESAFSRSMDARWGVWAALICEEQGWLERRDQFLSKTIEAKKSPANKSAVNKAMLQFCEHYVLANGSDQPDAALSALVHRDAQRFPNADFNLDILSFSGELLRLKGQTEQAKELLMKATGPTDQNRIVEFVPYVALRKMKIDPIRTIREKTVENE